MEIDVFNGDADGICALQQLHLARPRASELVTGIKRDIDLLCRVTDRADLAGARLTVLDISMAVNMACLQKILAQGAKVFYADHHKAGEIPDHPGLKHHIDLRPATCTALIINDYLSGAYPGWAVAAAFGDNFHDTALKVGVENGFAEDELARLRELGELLNYNGYGRDLDDLHFHPADLFQALQPFADPLDFHGESPALATLRAGFADDMERALGQEPAEARDSGRLYLFPAAPWARRSAGVFSNAKAREEPDKAHALLVASGAGTFVVSVRAPLATRKGAVELCQQFATGGGRAAAAGVNRLPEAELDTFVNAFFSGFS
ncbi:MAG: acetyltransferase [Thermodesulfobacteriota bacterium]